MRIIKLGLISVIMIFLVIFLLSLLIPSTVIVSRAMTVNAVADSVYSKIRDIREWKAWNVLLQDTSLSNPTFQYDSFRSDEMTVTFQLEDTAGIKTKWVRNGQEPVAGGFGITRAGGATIVQWYFEFHVGWYPWEKFGSIIFDKQLGPPMEYSLDLLKKICEKPKE